MARKRTIKAVKGTWIMVLLFSFVFSGCVDEKAYKNKIQQLESDNAGLRIQMQALNTEIQTVKAENKALTLAAQELTKKVGQQGDEILAQKNTIADISAKKDSLASSIVILGASIIFSFLAGFGIGKKLLTRKSPPETGQGA